jgi:hypothetical protein
MAIGARSGEIEINIAENSVSSSVLGMLDLHVNAAPESRYIGKESVRVQTLDDAVAGHIEGGCKPFLKIDTQGYEWEVLEGAAATLARACGIMCELSLSPLYDQQRSWKDVVARVEGAGFALWSLDRGFTDPATYRVLQADAVFFRTPR